MITVGWLVRVGNLLQRAEGGDARTGERRRALRRKIADVEQVARMRHHQEVGIAAIRKHAEAAHGAAKIFIAPLARLAGPAADPWMGKPPVAHLDAFRVGTEGDHLADVLVAERHRQLHAAVGEAHLLAAAEIEIPVRQMQIAVTDAGRQNFQQNFAAGRFRRGLFVELQRLATNADLEHAHWTLSRIFSFAGASEPQSAARVTTARCLGRARP